MEVSIIIVNYNTKDLLDNCIKSIYKHTQNFDFEIIVVDNASLDGSNLHIRTVFPEVVLIESQTNLGFGKANNLGVEYAKGEFLFFLNSDTILLNNAIFYFLDFFKNNQNLNIGCLGGVLFDDLKNHTHSSGSFPSMSKILINLSKNYLKSIFKTPFGIERYEFKDSNHFEVDYITGADLFLSKELFLKVGGFDPIFFMYFEETDIQKQINKLGFKQYLIKNPKIIHLEGGSNSKPYFSAKSRMMMTESLFKYLRKNYFILNYYIFRLLYLIIRLPILFDFRISYKERCQYIFSLIKYK